MPSRKSTTAKPEGKGPSGRKAKGPSGRNVERDPDLDLLKDLFSWVYCIGLKRFVDPKNPSTSAMLDRPQFAHKYRDVDKKPLKYYFDHLGKEVDRLTYQPGKGQVLKTEDGRTALNTYRPSSLQPTYGDVTPWLDLVDHVYPDDEARDYMLDYKAFMVQDPGVKINHALLVSSVQGVGKDSIERPIRAALGPHNCSDLTPVELTDHFTDWLENRKAIYVGELAAFHKRDLANRLKPLLASPPDTVWVNGKGVPRFTIPNKLQFLFFTNDQEPIALTEDDRRFWVYHSPAVPLAAESYVEYHRWVDAHASDVYGYLLQRDVSTFQPKAHPPMTSAKSELLEASRSELHRYLAEALAAKSPPLAFDLVTISHIKGHLPDSLQRGTTDHTIGKVLRALGLERLSRQAHLPPYFQPSRPRVWVVRGRRHLYEDLSEKALGERLQTTIFRVESPLSRQGS